VEERRVEEVDTPWGKVRGKVTSPGAGANVFAPEYEDCRAIAERTGIPLKQVLAAGIAAYEDPSRKTK
jgi:pyridinium-3,5-bisthiocarboxylic acid mononucleotide nickel chelatase